MAKDRILFIFSFVCLGLLGIFLFSHSNKIETSDNPSDKKIDISQSGEVKETVANEKNNPVLQLEPGKIAVPFQLTARSAIVQFMNPGKFVNIIFTSNPDIVFHTISFTLLNNIRIIDIGKDADGKSFTDKSSFYKSNTPIEILLEMTPRQSEILSFAERSGTVSLDIENDKLTDQLHNELVETLLNSNSDENFNSILVTHTIHSIFPDSQVKVLATSKGFIASGMVSNQITAENIIKILTLLAGDSKLVLNLLESAPGNNLQESNAKPTEVEVPRLPITPGKRAVLLELSAKSPIAQSLKMGDYVDVKFTSKSDIGFSPISLMILKDIPVLSISKNTSAMSYKEMENFYKENIPLQVFLEMTPEQAEIFNFAMMSGEIALESIHSPQRDKHHCFREILLRSASLENFQSELVTYMVGSFFPNVNVKITATVKGFILEGMVPDPQMAGKIIEILQKVIPGGERVIVNLLSIDPQQVLLRVKVFEVSSTFLSTVGINWKVLFQNNGTSFGLGAIFPAVAANTPDYFASAAGVSGNFTLSALIDMLEEDGLTKVLAEPNLTTISGETAHFFSGGEFPILIPQGGLLNGTVTVEYKKFGVMLDFTPIVELNGLITIHVLPEVSSLDRANSVVINGSIIPSIITRRADTIVKLWPGQSYVIAGLFLEDSTNRNDNLYGLHRIPFIGPLFKSNHDEGKRSELLIMITPYLVDDSNDCHKIEKPILMDTCPDELIKECFMETEWEPCDT